MRRTRMLTVVLAVALLATLFGPAVSPATAIPCSGTKAMETLSLRTFKIDAKPQRKTYKVGQTVLIEALVVRPDDTDPFQQGIPTDGVDKRPAEGINIGAGLLIGDVFLPGFAVTDAEGKALLKIKLEKYVKPAVVDVALYAWNVVQDTPCLRVEENGYRAYPEMFAVVK